MEFEDVTELGATNISKIVVKLNVRAPWQDSPISTDELKALSATAERLNTWIAQASILPPTPGAERAAQVELWTYQARVIGIAPDIIERMLSIADRVGPMSLLPNERVREATWQSMMERAARDESPIPDDEPPVAWADHIWTIMHGAPVRFEEIPHIVALTKALARARDESIT